MSRYIFKRLISVIPVLLFVATFSFLLIHFTPGDPAAAMLGDEATPKNVAILREQMGLDKPLYVQFIDWYSKSLRGDLGDSFYLGRPVLQALLERLPATFLLAVSAFLIAITIGIPFGVIAAAKHNSIFDRSIMVLSIIGISIPSFWLGLLLIYFFSIYIGVLPTGGYTPLSENVIEGLRHLIMPALSLGLAEAALISRMTRSLMLEIIQMDYIRTARSKGVSEFKIIFKHTLKNAMNGILTVSGLSFGILLGGAIITETVFAYPGVGRMIVTAVLRRDYPLIQGSLLMISLSYVFINLIVDILYTIFDPRIKY